MPRMPSIPIEELYPVYEDKIGKARKEGYSDQEILVHLQGYEKEARTEGYSRKEINQFLGRLPKESSQFTEGLISGAMLPLKALATPFVAGQEAIKDVGRVFQGKKPTFGEDIARLWDGEEVKGIYEDLAGQKLEETLKQKTPLGKTWYGASVADMAGAIEQAGEYMIDPLMIAPSIASNIALTVPKTFKKYITKGMATDIKNIEKAEWAEKDILRDLARQLENSKIGMPLLKPSEVSGVGKPPYYGGLKTEIGELPESVIEVTPGKLVGKPSELTPRIVIETLGDVEGGKALATKDKVDSGMRTGRDLLEHNKTITEPIAEAPEPQLGAKAEVGKVAKESFDEYLAKINPEGKMLTEKERPTVYVDDLEGIEDGSKLVKKIGSLEIKTDGESFYAVKDKKTVGYISPLSDKEIDLTVAKEYQNQGIGTELLTEFRKKNPFYQTGGLTEGGLKTEKRVFNKAEAGKPLEPLAGGARIKVEQVTPTETIISAPKVDKPSITPKEQKQYLLSEIQKAIDIAPEKVEVKTIDIGFQDNRGGVNEIVDKANTPTVKIEVPGDGVFEIINDKAHLKAFEKNVGSHFPGTDWKSTKASASLGSTKPVGKRIVGEYISYYNEFKPRKQDVIVSKKGRNYYSQDGWFTDVSYGIKTEKPVGVEVRDDLSFKNFIPSETTEAKIVGEFSDGIHEVPRVHVVDIKGRELILVANQVDTILTKYPKAKVFIEDVDNPAKVVFKENGKDVGVATRVGRDKVENLPESLRGRYEEVVGKAKPDVTEAFPIGGETFEQAKTRYEKHFGDYPFDLDLVKKTAEENKGISISVDSLNEMYYDKITGKKLTPTKTTLPISKSAEELLNENLIRPKSHGYGVGRRWEYRAKDGMFTVAQDKETAIRKANEALQAKAKPEGVKGGGTTLYSGIPGPELEKLIKNTITYAERAGQKAEDYLRSKGFSEQQVTMFLRNMAVIAKKELQETNKREPNLFVAPVHAVDKKLPSAMKGTEILNYDSPVYKDSRGKINVSGLKQVLMNEGKALGIVDDPALRVLNDEALGNLLEPFRKPYWVGVQYEKIVPQALKIVESQVLAENRRFILSTGFVDLAKQYFKIPTLSRQKVNKALHWGEANNIETIPDDILKKQFGLIPEEIEGYKGFRNSINASWDHKIQLMKEAEPPTTEVKRWQQWNEGYQSLLEQRIPGYVPHEWYGKYNVVRYNKDGEVATIDSFNTRYSARKHIMNIEKKEPLPPKLMRREEIPEGLYSGINADWTEAMIKKSAQKAGLPESEVNEILKSFDVEMKSRGWSKHLIHRKGVGGYREDLNNPLIDYLNGYAGSVTKAEKAVEFRKLFTDMSPDKVRGLKDYMKETIDYYLKPDSDAVNRRIKDVLFNFFLGGRLKQIPVQASQQLVSFTPMLSTITKGANRKLTKASMDLLRGKLSDEERMAFELVYNKYPEQMSSELTKELSGKKVYPGYDTIKTSADMARAILRKPIEFAEHTINRTPAFLTSFRVFKEQGATIEEAVDRSVDLIGKTHYLYGKANRAPLERGNFQTFLTFKSFMMNYLEEMAYLARHKELGAMARSAAAMTVLAGARGLPFAAVGIALYKNAFKESPETTLRKMGQEQGVKGAIGKVGTVGYVGMLDAFANIDASGSIGAGDLLFGNMDEVFEDPRKLISEIPKQVVGAPAGLVERGLTGAYELRRGNIRKGVEQLSPEVSRDPQVAYRMMTEGATTQEGHPIETEPGKVFKLTPFEAAQKGVMGLQSARYSRMMRERREIKDLIGDTNQLTDYYAHQLLRARDAKNREKWDRLQKELKEVNIDRRAMEMPAIIIKEEHIKSRKEANTVPRKWQQFDLKLRQAYR